MSTATMIQLASTTGVVNTPQFQMRSVLLRNFIAAASSRKPITTLVEFSQPPLFGSFASQPGKSASSTNGNANVALKTLMPISGQNHAPCVIATSSGPMNGAVQ